MAAVVVFDVIETLLDLEVLEPYFVRVFGDADARQQWFQRILKTALTRTVTGAYRDFGQMVVLQKNLRAALRDVAASSSLAQGQA